MTWATDIKKYAFEHTFISSCAMLIIIGGGYYTYTLMTATSSSIRYVTTIVATGTVVATLSESGQVSASSNIDILSKSSGEVLSLPVVAGQHVSKGAVLAALDSATAQQSVASAEQALQSAQIALASAEQDLTQTYEGGYNDVSAAFLALPSVITGLDAVLHGNAVPGHTAQSNLDAYTSIAGGTTVPQYRDLAESTYQSAYLAYTKVANDFKGTPRTADRVTIEALLNESYVAVATLADALKAATSFLDSVNTQLKYANTIPSTLAGHISTITSYTTTTMGHVTVLSADVKKVASTQLNDDPLPIQSAKLSLKEKQDALDQAEKTLADTVVRAPFSGTVAKLAVQEFQTIGNGTAVATLISDNQSVNISVNEVDVAKLKIGQKATITFDALSAISIAGTVSSINTIGTVSSGVVSYSAVVSFDTPNTDVKPGMSATVDIISGTETGLIVPSSAVKTANGQSYVEVFTTPLAGSESSAGATSLVAPTQVRVITGITDNANIIVRSGLTNGAQVVTKTIAAATATKTSTAAQNTSIFGGTGGGGAVRAITR